MVHSAKYLLIVESKEELEAASLTIQVENELSKNPYYKQALAIGQLALARQGRNQNENSRIHHEGKGRIAKIRNVGANGIRPSSRCGTEIDFATKACPEHSRRDMKSTKLSRQDVPWPYDPTLRVLLRKYSSGDDLGNESAPVSVIPAKAGIQVNSAQNKPGFPPARE